MGLRDLDLLLSLTHPSCLKSVRENAAEALQLAMVRTFNQNDTNTENQFKRSMEHLLNLCGYPSTGHFVQAVGDVLLKLGDPLCDIVYSDDNHKCREIIADHVMYFLLLQRGLSYVDYSQLCAMYKQWNGEHPRCVYNDYWNNNVCGEDGDGLSVMLEALQKSLLAGNYRKLPKDGTYEQSPQPAIVHHSPPQSTTVVLQPTTVIKATEKGDQAIVLASQISCCSSSSHLCIF